MIFKRQITTGRRGERAGGKTSSQWEAASLIVCVCVFGNETHAHFRVKQVFSTAVCKQCVYTGSYIAIVFLTWCRFTRGIERKSCARSSFLATPSYNTHLVQQQHHQTRTTPRSATNMFSPWSCKTWRLAALTATTTVQVWRDPWARRSQSSQCELWLFVIIFWLACFFTNSNICPNLRRPYGPTVRPPILSCVIMTLYALIWLVISHVGWHVIEVGPGPSELRERPCFQWKESASFLWSGIFYRKTVAVVIWVIVTTEQPDQTKERAVSAARFLQKGGREKTRCTNKNTRLFGSSEF